MLTHLFSVCTSFFFLLFRDLSMSTETLGSLASLSILKTVSQTAFDFITSFVGTFGAVDYLSNLIFRWLFFGSLVFALASFAEIRAKS